MNGSGGLKDKRADGGKRNRRERANRKRARTGSDTNRARDDAMRKSEEIVYDINERYFQCCSSSPKIQPTKTKRKTTKNKTLPKVCMTSEQGGVSTKRKRKRVRMSMKLKLNRSERVCLRLCAAMPGEGGCVGCQMYAVCVRACT